MNGSLVEPILASRIPHQLLLEPLQEVGTGIRCVDI
jgi:hypothetical protein